MATGLLSLWRNLALVDTLKDVGARHVGFRTPTQVDGILPAAALALTEKDVRGIEAKAAVK